MSGGDKLDFEIRPNSAPVSAAERAAVLAAPGFGRVMTDHMVTIRYADGKGWYDARVEPYAPIPMDPASAVFHYAQEIFEGLKAFRTADGTITMFRPEANAARFVTSARRMAMPPLPPEVFMDSLHRIIEIDRDWVPEGDEGSLYLRPFMFASEAFLGVRPASEYLYLLIASPAGAYFTGGVKPLSLWVSPDYTRAAPGGTGAAKCGGNYATSLAPQAEAIEHGCDQVIFLDAVERRYIDELGGMNVFFVYDDGTLVTPPLTGTILPGITRESIITLAREAGHPVHERLVSLDEWRSDAASGRLTEAFACGTAAVITPIGTVRSPEGEFATNGGEPGTVTMSLRQTLEDIQRGRIDDRHGWVHRVR
ncbi:branched-chain amino acid aminotransferase [Plantactinospora sp. GCM10030261]|uniref:branched-chain amino acid aminotransferase n=1 Tax=Plantactinospora sp. GCM10030261 TaxID=3273420 RepID=UPI0036169B23